MPTLPPAYGCPVPPIDLRHRAAAAPAAVVVLAATTIAGVLLTIGVAPAGAVPSTVLPAPDATGGEVTIEPAVVRAPDGQAELDVVLGTRAPDDVVVELVAALPVVAPDGTVTTGAAAEDVEITDGARLRPGERLRVRVVAGGEPVLVVARVHAATTSLTGADPAPGDGAPPVELAALLLPGDTGPAPQATIEATEGQLVATVTTTAPLLVTARLAGERATTHPDRLVLPSQPLVLEGIPARWPSPSVLTVTDEAGRTVTVDTGRTPLVVIAAVLLGTALAAAVVAARRHRAG